MEESSNELARRLDRSNGSHCCPRHSVVAKNALAPHLLGIRIRVGSRPAYLAQAVRKTAEPRMNPDKSACAN
jgi:hypothetical protein